MVKMNLSEINVPERIAEMWAPLNAEQREFLANKQTGIIEFVSGESFWTLFFKGSNELKQELTNKALELHRSEVTANIDFNLSFIELTD